MHHVRPSEPNPSSPPRGVHPCPLPFGSARTSIHLITSDDGNRWMLVAWRTRSPKTADPLQGRYHTRSVAPWFEGTRNSPLVHPRFYRLSSRRCRRTITRPCGDVNMRPYWITLLVHQLVPMSTSFWKVQIIIIIIIIIYCCGFARRTTVGYLACHLNNGLSTPLQLNSIQFYLYSTRQWHCLKAFNRPQSQEPSASTTTKIKSRSRIG